MKIYDQIDFEHIRSCRVPFLDFLRNLTPQTILLSFVILMTTKIDFTHFHFNLNNIVVTLVFYLLLACFSFSVYANSTIFIEKCFPSLYAWQSEKILLQKSEGLKWYRRLDRLILSVIKEKLFVVAGYMAMILFIQAAFIIVIAISFNSATKMWHDNHPSSPATKSQQK